MKNYSWNAAKRKREVNEDISGVKGFMMFLLLYLTVRVIIFSIPKRTNSLSLINFFSLPLSLFPFPLIVLLLPLAQIISFYIYLSTLLDIFLLLFLFMMKVLCIDVGWVKICAIDVNAIVVGHLVNLSQLWLNFYLKAAWWVCHIDLDHSHPKSWTSFKSTKINLS